MKRLVFALSVTLTIVGISAIMNSRNADAVTNAKSPIVLELFTSQSCSSCPAADKLLGELSAQNDEIIALSCNVTYWNHLHWKDTLSKDFCTSRQRQYIQTLQSRTPYTPQIIINGRHEMVGSRGNDVMRTIKEESENPITQRISMELNKDKLTVKLPEAQTDHYILLLIGHGNTHVQAIPSGENRGRTVSYTNPVDEIRILGTWDGKSKTITENVADFGHKGIVVLAQKENQTGSIIAAGKVSR
jgi:hypothetical protein